MTLDSRPQNPAGVLIGEQSLLFTSGQRHKYMRSLLMPAFNAEAVGARVPQLAEAVEQKVAAWALECAASSKAFPLSARAEIRQLTFSVIVQVRKGAGWGPASAGV